MIYQDTSVTLQGRSSSFPINLFRHEFQALIECTIYYIYTII